LHHIIFRGIERKAIFRDTRDYETFLDRFGAILNDSLTSCYAWALLPNHGHLLLKTGTVSLSTVMRRLLTGYAQYFNRRYRRAGHLFQNRYKSVLCEEDPYFLELVRYIHLNPLRARTPKVENIRALEDYAWSGHRVIMGKKHYTWQNTDAVLAYFTGKHGYRTFIEKGIPLDKRPDLMGGGLVRSSGGWAALRARKQPASWDERILGSSDFVASVLKQARETYDQRSLAAEKGISLDRVISAVATHLDLDPGHIKSAFKTTKLAQARALICYLSIDLLKVTGVEIAAGLGLTRSAVSKLASRGRSDLLVQEIRHALLSLESGDP
jgi:REP element-mobilizing transposase RayT